MQLNLNLATKEQLRQSWAFAVDTSAASRRSFMRGHRALNRCIITACSKQAKELGIRAGMRYDEAKALLPELRILIYNR